MICDPDEFLLILQNWITNSASVNFSFLLLADPIRPALSVTLNGSVVAIDPSSRSFIFSSNDSSVIVVHLSNWPNLSFLDKGALPRIKSIKEGFLLERPGASINLVVQHGVEENTAT